MTDDEFIAAGEQLFRLLGITGTMTATPELLGAKAALPSGEDMEISMCRAPHFDQQAKVQVLHSIAGLREAMGSGPAADPVSLATVQAQLARIGAGQ